MPDAMTMTVTPDGSGGLFIDYTPPSSGRLGNGCICYNWSPSTQLPHWNAALAAGGRAKIVCFGESTVAGSIDNIMNPSGLAWPNQMAVAMAKFGSVDAHYANFVGGQEEFYNVIANTKGSSYNTGYFGPGQGVWFISAAADNLVWLPEPGRISGRSFDRLDIFLDKQTPAPAPFLVSCGKQTNTVTPLAGTGMQVATIPLTADTFSSVTIIQPVTDTVKANIIHGAAFWNSTKPAIEVFNSGVGGSESNMEPAIVPGTLAALAPNLAIIQYVLNDTLYNNVPLATTIANLTAFITDLRAANCDVILVIPQPFALSGAPQIYTLDQLIDAMHTLAMKYNVGVIDLNSTYGNNIDAYGAVFISGGVHLTANGYADVGQRIAATLTNTAQTFPLSAAYSAAYPPNTNNGVLD